MDYSHPIATVWHMAEDASRGFPSQKTLSEMTTVDHLCPYI